jgi:hypothetical protein
MKLTCFRAEVGMGSHPARYGEGCVSVDFCCDVIQYDPRRRWES